VPETERPRLAPELVRAHVARVLESEVFSKAPSLRRLLSYVADLTVQGRADTVKEYSLGVEVFDRGDSFDPKADTIVRVQARRLRSKLEAYYAIEGFADGIVIELPRGGYVPKFLPAPLPPERPAPDAGPAWKTFGDPGQSRPAELPTARQAWSLPVPRTALIGRESEVATILSFLRSAECRFLTLTGPGGSGKTRLALQVASEAAGDFPGGVVFVGLGSVTDPADVGAKLAQTLGLRRIESGSVDDALREHARTSIHARTLIVVDNFEQLLPAASLLAALVDATAAVSLLITSRAVLHVSGEQCFHVPPLRVPDLARLPPVERLAESPAVALFVRRARASQASFALTAENASTIADICARLDGLPLAIELAAARIRILSPVQIRARLESRLELLTCGGCDLPVRQQTLRQAIDWSHDLLTPSEKRLFRRLAVFAGSCTLEGAEAVCNPRQDLETGVLDSMSSLVDQSLIRQVDEAHGELRFAMLETVREYALEQLDLSGERAATQRAHAAYCIVLAEEGSGPLTAGPRADWLARCHSEHDNHRAALEHLIGTDDGAWALRLALALFEYWERREHRLEGYARFEAILKLPSMAAPTKDRAMAITFASLLASAPDAAARAAEEALALYREMGDLKGVVGQLNNLGVNRRLLGDYAGARQWLEQSVRTCRELGDRAASASALSNLADVLARQGHAADARALLVDALALFREAGHAIGQAWSLNHLGDLARASGQLDEARQHYQQGADIFRALGDPLGIARSAVDLGHLASEAGDRTSAHAYFADALRTFVALNHKLGIAIALEAFARAAVEEQDVDRALTLAAAAAGVRCTVGSTAALDRETRLDGRLAALLALDDVHARACRMSGSNMAVDEIVEYALDACSAAVGDP
jgi:predicted ATPase